MHYIIWILPALTVLALLVVKRTTVTVAASIGTLVALIVSILFPPTVFPIQESAIALLRGAWIGWVVMPYILGGLLFWQLASNKSAQVEPAPALSPLQQRRLLFSACFIVGPFAEVATGFGIGMLATLAMIRVFQFKPTALIVFGLMSQTLAPWGALGSGTIVASAMAGVPTTTLTLACSAIVAVLWLAWVPVYWRFARENGITADKSELKNEALWLAASLALLTVLTYFLGTETAGLASYGLVIVLRFFWYDKPDHAQVKAAVKRVLPYVSLISILVIIRIIPPVHDALTQVSVAPFAGLPIWIPMTHAGTWLILVAIGISLLQNRIGTIGEDIKKSWATGRGAVYATFLFGMMAEILTQSGISSSLANGMRDLLQHYVILLTPILGGAFAMLSNSGNASNGLFMSSQVILAKQGGYSVLAVVALQHCSAVCMSLFSPTRIFMAASMGGVPGYERDAYKALLPFILRGFIALVIVAAMIILASDLFSA
jgi:lactate permease